MCGQRVVLVVLFWITLMLNGSVGEELLLTTIDRCGEAPLIDNGDIVERSRVHLKYQCGPGYTLYGEDTVLCHSNMSWSELPHCIGETVCFDPEIANANYTKFQYVENNVRIRIRCNTGYEDKRKRATAICLNGNWTVLPVCEKMDSWCGPPPQVPNAIITNQVHKDLFPEDDYVEYVCMDGFELETNNNYTTCSYGQWLTPPTCRPKQTGQDGGRVPVAATASPGSSDSGNNNQPLFTTIDRCGIPQQIGEGEYNINADKMRVIYRCSYWYKLKGNDIVRCHNGEWTELPTCEVDFCKLDTSRYSNLVNIGSVFIKSGTRMKLDCYNDSWKTARAVCNNNQLSLSRCCLRVTHSVNHCEYFLVQQ